MPTQRLTTFGDNLARASDLVGLGEAVGGLTYGRVDESEMYRSAWTLAVGALDSYVHGVVLDRGVEIILGRITATTGDKKVSLHLPGVSAIVTAGTPADQEIAARTYFAERLTLETFQSPDDIAKALAIVGVGKIWTSAFANSEVARTKLSLVVRRRNAIVHQCDADPVTHATVTPITADDARAAIEVVRETAEAIDNHLLTL